MSDQLQGGARAVDGDQQVTAAPGRNLRDGLGQHRDVVAGGVRPGPARSEQERQRLPGVVTPCRQRVMTVGPLERAGGLLLVTVRDLDRGVHADHHRRSEVHIGHLRGGDAAVPGLDQRPHLAADLRPRGGDPRPLVGADLLQRPPQRRVRGHRPVQLTLIAQRRQVRQHPAAISDTHRGVDQHPAPVVHRGEPAPTQRLRQRPGQPGVVGEQPQHRRPGVGHDTVTGHFHGQVLRPRPRVKLHLKSAPRPVRSASSTTAFSQLRGTFRCHNTQSLRSR